MCGIWLCKPGTFEEARQYLDGWRSSLGPPPYEWWAEIVVCPATLQLLQLKWMIEGMNLQIGAQGLCADESSIASQGQVSAEQLYTHKVPWAIVGMVDAHGGSLPTRVCEEVQACQRWGIKAIVCIPLFLEDRLHGRTPEWALKRRILQVATCVHDWDTVVLCLLPTWEHVNTCPADQQLSPDEAQLCHALMRSIVSTVTSTEVGQSVRIVYGGRMQFGRRCSEFLMKRDIDGFCLVGWPLEQGVCDLKDIVGCMEALSCLRDNHDEGW